MTGYLILDVFTRTPLHGNPLAVVPDARALPEDRLQAIAREFNLSETAFVLPPENPAHDAKVRIFTPAQELPFAGHPNIGTAVALGLLGEVLGRPAGKRLRFEEAAGLVLVDLLDEGGQVTGASVRAPSPFSKGPERPAATVARLCGLPDGAILSRTHTPCYASVGTGFLVAEVTRDGLAAAFPDPAGFAAEQAEAPSSHLPALFLWADLGHAGPVSQVEARMFAPLSGVTEDAATGSAAAALGGLLASLGGPTSLSVAQGLRIGRPSRIGVEARRDGVWISGEAVPVMEGRLL